MQFKDRQNVFRDDVRKWPSIGLSKRYTDQDEEINDEKRRYLL